MWTGRDFDVGMAIVVAVAAAVAEVLLHYPINLEVASTVAFPTLTVASDVAALNVIDEKFAVYLNSTWINCHETNFWEEYSVEEEADDYFLRSKCIVRHL